MTSRTLSIYVCLNIAGAAIGLSSDIIEAKLIGIVLLGFAFGWIVNYNRASQ